MYPPVHPAVAYLLYSGLTRTTRGEAPGGLPTLALVVGAILPDLIDQPLALIFDLPTTRTLAHSLLVAVPVSAAVILAVRRSSVQDAVGSAFAVGYLSHQPADAIWPIVVGDYHELGFLLWPITHSPPYTGRKSLATVGDVTVTTLWIELVLFVAALALWWSDGRPGVGVVRDRISG